MALDLTKEAEKRATATTKVDPVTIEEKPKEIDDTVGKILPTDDIVFPAAQGRRILLGIFVYSE